MPQQVDDIHSAIMRDPDFKPQDPSQSKEEAAWAVAWSRYKQMQKNEAALSLAKDTWGPDEGESKVPGKQGHASTVEVANKKGLYELQRDDPLKGTDQVRRTATEGMRPLQALQMFVEKADRMRLVPKKVQIKREGRTFEAIRWTKPPGQGAVLPVERARHAAGVLRAASPPARQALRSLYGQGGLRAFSELKDKISSREDIPHQLRQGLVGAGLVRLGPGGRGYTLTSLGIEADKVIQEVGVKNYEHFVRRQDENRSWRRGGEGRVARAKQATRVAAAKGLLDATRREALPRASREVQQLHEAHQKLEQARQSGQISEPEFDKRAERFWRAAPKENVEKYREWLHTTAVEAGRRQQRRSTSSAPRTATDGTKQLQALQMFLEKEGLPPGYFQKDTKKEPHTEWRGGAWEKHTPQGLIIRHSADRSKLMPKMTAIKSKKKLFDSVRWVGPKKDVNSADGRP